MTKRTVLVVLAGILFIAVSGCSLGSGGGSDDVDSVVDPTGNVPIEDGWFTHDGDETVDDDGTGVTAGDETEIADDDATEPAGDEGTLRDVKAWIPTVGKIDLVKSDERARPRTTAISIDRDGAGDATPGDTGSDDDVIVGVAVGSSSSDEGGTDVNIVKGNAVATDSEIKELELTIWTGHDDAARLKKSIAWFQFCSDRNLEDCSDKFRLNETNVDFQPGSVAKITVMPYAFGDYFGEADSVREKSKYFKISLEKKGKDNWELQGLKLIYVKHDGTRELAYFNPCVHKWLRKSSYVRFGPDDTALCAIVATNDVEGNLNDNTIVLDFDDFGHADESGNNTCSKDSPHFRSGHDDFYMGFKGYDDWKADAVRSYGDWSFDSDPFDASPTGIPGGFSTRMIKTNNCNNCVIDGPPWGFDRIKVYVYRPADNFIIRANGATGVEEIVAADPIFVADTYSRDDVYTGDEYGDDLRDHANILTSWNDRYPESDSNWVEFKNTYVFEYDNFGPEAIGGIDFTAGTNPAL